MSDLVGNHNVGFPTRRFILLHLLFIQKMKWSANVLVVYIIVTIVPVPPATGEQLRTGCYEDWRDCDWGKKIGPGDKVVGCNDLCRCWGYVGGHCVRLKYGRCPRDELNLPYYSCECQLPRTQKDSFWCRRGGY